MTAGEGTPKRSRFSSAFAMSRPADVATPRRRRRCLFGAPDRDETERLVAEQYQRDRRRYIRRFNFDVETEAAYTADSPVARSPAALAPTELPGTPRRRAPRSPLTPKSPRTPAKSPRTPRRSPRTPASRRQLHMTDYWAIRKCSESSPSDKEN